MSMFPQQTGPLRRVGSNEASAAYADEKNTNLLWLAIPLDRQLDELDEFAIAMLFKSLSDDGIQALGQKLLKAALSRGRGSIADQIAHDADVKK